MKNINLSLKKCPICEHSGKFIFVSRHNHFIYQCLNKNCGHFWVPEYTNEQLLYEREENLENESNNNLKIFGRRNKKLFTSSFPHLYRITIHLAPPARIF